MKKNKRERTYRVEIPEMQLEMKLKTFMLIGDYEAQEIIALTNGELEDLVYFKTILDCLDPSYNTVFFSVYEGGIRISMTTLDSYILSGANEEGSEIHLVNGAYGYRRIGVYTHLLERMIWELGDRLFLSFL